MTGALNALAGSIMDGPAPQLQRDSLVQLLLAMVKQSLKDIVLQREQQRENVTTPADVATSASWPRSATGMQCLEFLMPDASIERAVAILYDRPEAVLRVMDTDALGALSPSQTESAGGGDDCDEADETVVDAELVSAHTPPLMAG